MDAHRFDSLTKILVAATSRRGFLRLLTALPGAGAVVALVESDADAAGRRHRRKTRHKHQRGDDKENRKGLRTGDEKGKDKDRCRPRSLARTCAGKCATVTDRCGGRVDCGPCSCGSCPICKICDATTGECVVHAAAAGQACGPAGRTCGGGGTPGVCGCTPVDPCPGACGTLQDGCGQNVECGACPVIVSFTATPATIERTATPPQTSSTLAWSVTNADTCSIDNGVPSVSCSGNIEVEPSATTTYTLTATSAGGASVTAPATVTVQYCHSFTSPGDCTTGMPRFCVGEAVSATNPAHAVAACDACFGSGACTTDLGCNGVARPGTPGAAAFRYFAGPGEIVGGFCFPIGRWAP